MENVLRNEIIEVAWIDPLEVQLQSGLNRMFRSVNDARLFLEDEWPIRHGSHYERALMFCRAAEARQVSSEVAREAFLAACLEAGLNVQASCWTERRGRTEAANVNQLYDKPPAGALFAD
jgi:hypothetical protein